MLKWSIVFPQSNHNFPNPNANEHHFLGNPNSMGFPPGHYRVMHREFTWSSTRKVLSPPIMLSWAPSLVNILSTGAKVISSAGT